MHINTNPNPIQPINNQFALYYTLIEQSHTLIESSPALFEPSHALIEPSLAFSEPSPAFFESSLTIFEMWRVQKIGCFFMRSRFTTSKRYYLTWAVLPGSTVTKNPDENGQRIVGSGQRTAYCVQRTVYGRPVVVILSQPARHRYFPTWIVIVILSQC